MKVKFATPAIWDLLDIAQYISERSPSGALKVERAIRRVANTLAAMPLRGRKQRGRNVRKIGVERYPYDIFYQVDLTTQIVTILHIRHAARRRKYRDA